MQRMKRIFAIIQKADSFIVSLALMVMIAVVFLQTFCRFVIFRSLSWSEELSRYLFVALIVLGVNLAITKHLFVRIEIIDNYIKGKGAVVINLLRRFIALLVNMIFVYSSYELIIIGGYQTSPAMRVPMSVLYALILVGFILNVCSVIIDLYETYGSALQEEGDK